MPKEKRKRGGEEPSGAPGWMVTYGDMMSLLLCFFVLLLSFSSVSEKKYSQAVQSLKGALGVLPRNLSVIQPLPIEQLPLNRLRTIERIGRMIQERLLINTRPKTSKSNSTKKGGSRSICPAGSSSTPQRPT